MELQTQPLTQLSFCLLLGVRIVELTDYACQPTPTVFKVPPPSYIPRYVILTRCIGSIYIPGRECVATKKEPLEVKVYTQEPPYLAYHSMSNDTQCGDQCIIKKEDCTEITRIYRTLPHCDCKCVDDFQCEKGKVWFRDNRIMGAKLYRKCQYQAAQ